MLTHTKATILLPTTEVQDNPWRETLTPRTKKPSDYQHEDIDDFENVEKENHTRLRDLTIKVDHL